MSTISKKSSIVLVDGCRTPFQKPGTGYRTYRAHDLARFAIRGLLDRTGVDPGLIDRVVLGSVIQDPETANVAREAALGAGLPASVPAQTVAMSCLSGHLALTTAAEAIISGQAGVVIAGGTESASAWLNRYPLKRHRALPFLKEFSTGETMGEYADRLAALYGISREAQDAYTVRSHQSAVRAEREGLLDGEIVPVTGPPDFVPVTRDNLVRPDTTPETLAALKPAFDHKFGTVTAANASHYADGAAAVLLMSEEKAEALGLEPLARLASWTYTASDPKDRMLLGQLSAIPKLLGGDYDPADIDVFELQETFAAQIMAVLDAAAGGGLDAGGPDGGTLKTASIPLRKMNTLGGTLALGHVFGATGVRLAVTAAHRIRREKGRHALVSGCAGGGLGHAMLLEAMDAPKSAARPKGKASKRKPAETAASGKTKATSKAASNRKAAKPGKPKNKPQAK
jgi:acetyl-CoA acetyltransferase family protein